MVSMLFRDHALTLKIIIWMGSILTLMMPSDYTTQTQFTTKLIIIVSLPVRIKARYYISCPIHPIPLLLGEVCTKHTLISDSQSLHIVIPINYNT